ncbi:hypothetical protein [Aquamicrobium defluvii]|uniref:Uncharacterized protein n=1 Tax=Aquamicrobium defluvii TaxID=69279 RepID=A0A4R6YIC1_9HYPH|nr:hypothetical protein [Aquamicrobium defluvii]TDR36533.1 hypothetical protein DES43_105200 [Aquamicrobium defluvii]
MTVPVPGSLTYSYDEDGVTTVFPYPVRFLEPQELTVIREVAGVRTVLAYNVDYTVSGAGNPSGGSIVRTAVTNGGKIIIARSTEWKQIVDLEDKARNPAQAVEDQLDRLTMAGQDTNERLGGKADAASLAPVAFSGDYDDLENKPFIPPGTVTSVGLSAPTGFTVSGSPVIGSGTLSFSYSTGYQGYTTAEASKLAGVQAGAQVNTVTSVAGKTGAVALVKADVGLGSVDNTSDADKPVSSAAQSALDAKADKAIAITAGAGLTGGGALDASRTISLSSASQVAIAAAQTAVQPGSLGDLATIDLPPSPSGLVLGDGGTWVLPAGGGDMLSSVYDPQGKAGDAFSRGNHTGTQAISTISGLQSALDAKADNAALAGKFDIPTGTTSQYIRGDGSLATFPAIPAGTVTSVGLSAPTGFTVSGSPVTGSGTLTFAYAPGYTGFTTTLQTKLNGIATGATANQTDAYLLNRANHTGVMPFSALESVQSGGRVLGRTSGTGWSEISLAGAANANSVAYRGTGGVLEVGMPTADAHAATKKYVDDGIASVVSWTETSPVAATTGTAIDWTSIPSGVNDIELWLKDVILSGNDALVLQVGPGASPVISGYSSGSGLAGASTRTRLSSGFVVFRNSASYTYSGVMRLHRTSGNDWVSEHVLNDTATDGVSPVGGGAVSLAGVLGNLRLRSQGGSQTFSGGSIQMRYR